MGTPTEPTNIHDSSLTPTEIENSSQTPTKIDDSSPTTELEDYVEGAALVAARPDPCCHGRPAPPVWVSLPGGGGPLAATTEGLSCHSVPAPPELAAAGAADVPMEQLENLFANDPILSLL